MNQHFRSPIDLRGAFIRRTDLSFADLRGANLSHADCTNAVFRGADFKDAILDKTILNGADLSEVKNLTPAQIKSAVTDETTVLPNYLTDLQ